MSPSNKERVTVIGLLLSGLLWMETERRRLVGELREERRAKDELLGDFVRYVRETAEQRVAEARGRE